MIFDDHDIIDDWNTSATWVRRMRGTGWWDDRITGGLMTYWIYQHIGNLAPPRLDENEQWRHVRENADDAADVLREFAFAADREVQGTRWSYSRDIAGARIVMIDSRAGRVLEPGARSMLDEDEWSWLDDRIGRDGIDHLLIGSSLPVLLMPGAALPRGLERGRLRRRLGHARWRAGARRCARGSTSSTGPRSASRSSA